MRELSVAWLLVIAAVFVQHGSSMETLSDAADGPSVMQDPVFSQLLGEAADAPNQLAEQNSKLQGAIQAIEQGTPPPGMEAMLGGAAAAPAKGGETAAGASKASAISEGIKMAMKSVKPLMDKYVATARALTNKYTLLKKRFKTVSTEYKGCPNAADIDKRIKLAVSAAETKLNAKYKKKAARLHRKIKAYTTKCRAQKQKLAMTLAKIQETEKTDKSKFHVELAQARSDAKTALTALRTDLKTMMSNELAKREAKVEKMQKSDAKEKDTKAQISHAKKMQEEKEKKLKQDKDLADEKAAKSKEAIEKKKEQKENRIKQDAADEARMLNRKTVMLSARKAVADARIAGRMARKMSHDADTNLENARLKKAKKMTEADVQALAKLRQHEDLAQTAVDSAREKKEKISRLKYSVTSERDKAEKRKTRLARQDQWEKKRVGTLSEIAAQARSNTIVAKKEAEEAAATAGLPSPVITVPPEAPPVEETQKEKTAHKEREIAREQLEKAHVPIPAELEPGGMQQLERDRTDAAAVSGAPTEDKSATVMKEPKLPPAPDATPEGHALRDRIRTHSAIEAAKQKTENAEVQLNAALVKRSTARAALKSEGQPIPDTLAKGGLDAEKEKLADAAARAAAVAKSMEQEEQTQTGGSITDPKSSDTPRTAAVKQQATANEADLKAQNGVQKVKLAAALRKKARMALNNEGKTTPGALSKATFKPIRERAKSALQKAKKLKVEAGLGVVDKGVGPPGVTPENAKTCYEAELANFPNCRDYLAQGYSCSKDHKDGQAGFCAADECLKDCKQCAKAAPKGHVVDVRTGRCRPRRRADEVTQL